MDLRKQILHKIYKPGAIFSIRTFSLFCMFLCVFFLIGCGKEDKDIVVTKSYGNLSYKYDKDMETIPVTNQVRDHYENFEWDRQAAFENLKETITYVTDNNTDYEVHASIDKYNNFMVRIYGEDKSHTTMSGEVRVINDTAYLKVSSNNMEKDTYFVAPYDKNNTNLVANIYCEVFNLAKSIQTTDVKNKDVQITYNCRTMLNDREVDNITISFYDDPSYTYVLFIDANTQKVVRISSSVISGNDMTDLIYNNNATIEPYTEYELKNSTNGEATNVDDNTMAQLFDTICYGIYNKDVESEDNKDVE